MNQLGLVEPADGLGQGVVIAVSLAAYQRLYARFGQPLGVADADVLRASVGVANRASITFWLSGIQGLLQRIEYEVRTH